MKVSAAPFEAPVGTTRSGDKASVKSKRDGREPSLHLVRSPASSQSVRAGLDSATKEALKQLVDLAGDSEEEPAEQEHGSQGDGKKRDSRNHLRKNPERGPARDPTPDHFGAADFSDKARDSRQDKAPSKAEEKTREPLEPEALQPVLQSVNAISRLQEQFEAVRKLRGREVYRQVLRDQAMSQIEDQFRENLEARATKSGEFEDVIESILDLGVDFLESEASTQVDPPSTSKTNLKRVA
jgi:hypothetical protein